MFSSFLSISCQLSSFFCFLLLSLLPSLSQSPSFLPFPLPSSFPFLSSLILFEHQQLKWATLVQLSRLSDRCHTAVWPTEHDEQHFFTFVLYWHDQKSKHVPHSPRLLWPIVWNPFPSLPLIVSLVFELKESEVRCICCCSSTDADRSSSVRPFHHEPNTRGPVQYQLVHEIMKHMLSTLLFPILHWGSSPGTSVEEKHVSKMLKFAWISVRGDILLL